jgi:5-methylcytosine-specific restriction endonuclease McrA
VRDPRHSYEYQQLAKRLCRSASECAICGRVLLHDAPPRSPWSPSLDHLMPVAFGGTNALENLRVVHVSCNSRRGARQPRLRRRRRPRRRGRVSERRLGPRVSAESWLGSPA